MTPAEEQRLAQLQRRTLRLAKQAPVEKSELRKMADAHGIPPGQFAGDDVVDGFCRAMGDFLRSQRVYRIVED